MSDNLIYDNIKLILDGRQESAVRRFTSCIDVWGILLLHKVGTGKTITSLLIALNTYKKKQIASSIDNPLEIVVIAPIGIYAGFINDLIGYVLFFENDIEKEKLRNDIKINGGENNVFKFFDVYFKLINYSFDKLIYDLNQKAVPIYDNKIIIIDEAHRLLTNDIYNSTEAAGAMKKHSLIDDILFQDSISKALRVITMSGTPMQQSPADLCKFGNFLTKSDKFSSSEYASKIADLVWVTFMIKQIEWIKTITSFGSGLAYSALIPGGIAVLSGSLSLAGLAPIVGTALLIGVTTATLNLALTTAVQKNINAKLAANQIKISRGGKKTKKNIKNSYLIKKNKTAKKYSNNQHGGSGNNMVVVLNSTLIQILLNGSFNFIKSKIPPTNKIIETAITSVGVGTDSAISELAVFSPFSSESKDILNVIEEPVFNIKYLAKSLSPIISIYDYELQNTINLACLKQINEILNKIMNPSNPISYDTLSKEKIAFTREQSINCLIEINKIKEVNTKEKITKIMDNNPKCDMELEPSSDDPLVNNINTRFPDKITELKVLFFDDVQKNFIRKFCLNLLTDKEKSIFYLNKYEKISLDYKEKLLFFVNNMKFISNFSEDVINYYSYLDQSITDPSKKYNKYVYKKRDDNDTAITEKKADIFKCKKFEDALELIKKINTGKMPIIKDEKFFDIDHPHGKDDNDPVKQYDELKTGYYLPVVYSYNEDFGLGLFANFLESRGHNYILINKLQENIGKGNENGKDLLEQNKTAGFLKTYSGAEGEPICVLIDPTMTEGLNAKFNPAILILESCNTFGDSEQVEGRVLRKYGLSYKSLKKKVIYQFLTNCDNVTDKSLESYFKPYRERFYVLKDTLTEQLRIGNAFSFTVREYNQASSAFKYISPDSVCYDKIRREKNNLQNFERGIKFGIANADLKETSECEKITNIPKEEEFLINFNTNEDDKSEDLFFDCKTLENKNEILEIQSKLEKYPGHVQVAISTKLKEIIDKLNTDYENAYKKLYNIFEQKYKPKEGTENLEYNSLLDKLYIKTFASYTYNNDNTDKEFMVAYFISTRADLFNTDQIISSAQSSTLKKAMSSASSLISRQRSEEYFTAQEVPFNSYIERKLNELQEKQLLENQRLRQESLINEQQQQQQQQQQLQQQQKKDAKKQRKEANREAARAKKEESEKTAQERSIAPSTRSQNPVLNSGVSLIPKKVFNPVTQTSSVPMGATLILSDGRKYDIEMAKQLKNFITQNGNNENMFRQPLSEEDIQKLNLYIEKFKGGKTRKNKILKINKRQTRKIYKK